MRDALAPYYEGQFLDQAAELTGQQWDGIVQQHSLVRWRRELTPADLMWARRNRISLE